MKLFVILLAAVLLPAQTGSPVRISDDPSPVPVQKIIIYSGTNVVAVCSSPSVLSSRVSTSVGISAATNASPVALTSTGHGFFFLSGATANTLPSVTISGGTGNWAAINGTWTATVTSANAFTIPVDSTSFGSLAGTVTFTTTAPRTTVFEWSVFRIAYDTSSNSVWTGWVGGSTAYRQRCSDYNSTTVTAQ